MLLRPKRLRSSGEVMAPSKGPSLSLSLPEDTPEPSVDALSSTLPLLFSYFLSFHSFPFPTSAFPSSPPP